MGGFESACHVNEAGVRLDMLRATQHDRFVVEDYRALVGMRIATVRDTIRWHRVEAIPHTYDWIAGVDAIWSVDPNARVVSVEHLIHTVPPRGLRDEAAFQRRRSKVSGSVG